MSDEEKKALERIDYIQDFIIENGQYNADVNDMEYFSRIKNLIEKQSKEIEELKKYKEGYKLLSYSLDNYTSKDKIKAKIEEYKNKIKKIRNKKLINEPEDTIVITRYAHYISVLQSLLEKE